MGAYMYMLAVGGKKKECFYPNTNGIGFYLVMEMEMKAKSRVGWLNDRGAFHDFIAFPHLILG